MVRKKSVSGMIFDTFNYIFLTLLALVCLYPVYHVLIGSFSDPVQLTRHYGAILKPLGFSLEGYKVVFHNPNIWSGYANTLFYVVVGTLCRMLFTLIGAYLLSRKDFVIRKGLTFIMVFTMYFSGGMIPSFLVVKMLRLYNSRAAIILPTLISTWNMIIMKTALQAVPDALEESARLDGANDLVVLFQILVPVVKATIAVIALYYIVGEWNSWFNAMIYLRDNSKRPLQLFLREILIENSTNSNAAAANVDADVSAAFLEESIKYCTIIVATVPILCIYPFVQKYFVTGVMMGSVKG